MSSKYFILPISLFLIYSCGSETSVPPIASNDSLPPEDSIVSMAPSGEEKTIDCNGKLILVSDTTKAVFDSFYKIFSDTSEKKNLAANSDVVKRSGDTLRIALIDEQFNQYVNVPPDDSDGLTDYTYLGKLKDINYHLLFVSFHESYSYLLVNAASGKEKYISGIPAISPDKTKIACAGLDLMAGFVFNGLQLYKLSGDSLSTVFSRELVTWGAENAAWLDNKTLLVEKVSVGPQSEPIKSYVKLRNYD